MAVSKRKTPAKKTPAKKPAAKKAEAEQNLVAPMHPDAFKLAMTIVNQADIKGGDAETIVLLKRELARVSGAKPTAAPRG